MSESENIKRCLDQAAGIAKEHILLLENDVRCLNYQLGQERKKTKALDDAVYYETIERLSQESKAEAALLFMFLFGCLTAISIAYAVLNCQ